MTYEEQENWEFLYAKMRDEGFHYCFKHYSDFEEIEDKKLHELRLQYLKSANELEDYIIEKYKESQETEIE